MALTPDPPVGIPQDPPTGGGGGGGGGGDASAANQTTEIARLTSIVTNTAGVATAANQATQTTALGTLLTNTQLRATPVDVNITGGGGGGGDATAANQATEITALGALLTNTQLRATPVPVSGSVTISDGSGPVTVDGTVAVTGVATAANQATEITGLASIDGHVDGLETLSTAANASLALIAGYLDDINISVQSVSQIVMPTTVSAVLNGGGGIGTYRGFTIQNASDAVQAKVIIRDGNTIAGAPYDFISLAPKESARELYSTGVLGGGYIFVEIVEGSVQGYVRYTT